MTDSTLNRFVSSGTAAERAAFTPDPPTAASGPDVMYIWLENDTGDFYGWDPVNASWTQLNVAGVAASTTEVLTGTDTSKYVTPDALAALWEQGGDIASAGTISVGEGGYFHITGTTTITDIDFGTTKAGRAAKLVFDGILTLTHNATTLILPTGANITTAAGDTCLVVSEGGDNVRVTDYMRKDGTALAGGASGRSVTRVSLSGLSTYSFTSIPGTFRTARLIVVGRTTVVALTGDPFVRVNGLSTSIYSVQRSFAQNTSLTGDQALLGTSISPVDFPGTTATAGIMGCLDIEIYEYAGTVEKTGRFTGRQPNSTTTHNSFHFMGGIDIVLAAAITDIEIALAAGAFDANSYATLILE